MTHKCLKAYNAWRMAEITKRVAWDKWIKTCDVVVNARDDQSQANEIEAFHVRLDAEQGERDAWRGYREAHARRLEERRG